MRCSFCIIPQLRGKLQSRGLGDVMREAERLVAAGVQELLVISQDTSAYGLDLGYAKSEWRGEEREARFVSLLRSARLARRLGAAALCLSLSACRQGLAADGRGACAALSRHPLPACEPERVEGDAPARASGKDAASASPRWREICPDLAIRSTFIVGFPGETEQDFELLLDWLSEARLNRVGCFKYENVDGAGANALPRHVAEEVKAERYDAADGASAADQHRAACRADRARPSKLWSMKSTRRAPSRAQAGMRRKSTAASISTGNCRSRPATGSRSSSSTPTNTISGDAEEHGDLLAQKVVLAAGVGFGHDQRFARARIERSLHVVGPGIEEA